MGGAGRHLLDERCWGVPDSGAACHGVPDDHRVDRAGPGKVASPGLGRDPREGVPLRPELPKNLIRVGPEEKLLVEGQDRLLES